MHYTNLSCRPDLTDRFSIPVDLQSSRISCTQTCVIRGRKLPLFARLKSSDKHRPPG